MRAKNILLLLIFLLTVACLSVVDAAPYYPGNYRYSRFRYGNFIPMRAPSPTRPPSPPRPSDQQRRWEEQRQQQQQRQQARTRPPPPPPPPPKRPRH
ncbi:hypothetical protein OESDEN_07169 [Oesophagostomum dentatum]|uniref:Uncharacterized protein n=1 Tax=Oesophagostomum dentatum TaxID=61180 RepID=A0A0B1T5S1_OESDE|nr:hypothetical protein OESDEN_07169 [Oesophagostomum dentatum]